MVLVNVRRVPLRGVSWDAVSAGAARTFGRVPPPALVLCGIVSVQLGATVATKLFALTGPSGAVALRLGFAALILLAVWRPSLRMSRSAWAAVLVYGLVLGTMNLCFYEAISRIPLGMAVTIEFLGPLTVSIVGARRWVHAVWAVLAAGGVVLLTGSAVVIDWAGVGFALAAATCWGTYILAGGLLGKRTSGGGGLAVGMAVAALLAMPLGVVGGGGVELLQPMALLIGLCVALLSSVIPYSLELEALRRIPPRVFGVLMSLEPAVAALAGLVVLGEALHPAQWVAICCVVTASIGATRMA